MLALSESTVEDAALTWFGEQSHFARTLIPVFSQREKERREAIRRLNPAIPEEARATIRDFRIVENSTQRELKP